MRSMRALPLLLAMSLAAVLASACGGKIVVPGGDGGDGGGGSDGGSKTTGVGSAKDCSDADCVMNGDICSCTTLCGGPKLRADCKVHEGGMLICECHYDGGYMGTCSASAGQICSLPDGCCEAYVP